MDSQQGGSEAPPTQKPREGKPSHSAGCHTNLQEGKAALPLHIDNSSINAPFQGTRRLSIKAQCDMTTASIFPLGKNQSNDLQV